ncbi:L-fucose isomerase [Parabacteroides sp. PF5-5]|uniref:L-fucose isomerase n=1 Tax=unclassified Parabacteroides TaxID=2649774 RepID=UPI002476F039|nr:MULTISPECIES: L-fucose isomerase [unclassified Parabacteroides]MDH6305129.1 L-fucose isomerase [Parabacteroides sp. PH5-39]MDH6316479.1 L-fucose isomerase [Parabacteroides sp. PF5-13]MDH6319989.1 L-fucose isomerase [Parabacteroides sp. PH5-13]MDH6323778.1 L-fucose isomerase [Parabacteroides sp. PH5-8]MDH6327666.1 L-fucose isomerase [Parabacteroides sp. PH5-41]
MKHSFPKIGIRPVIDGRRRGVRESLEDMTMGLAKRVAQLYSETLRYPDGSAVECVIADTCIGGVKEAANCAEKFEKAGVGVSLSVTPCWCYGSETIDMNPHIPKAIWGFNGTERPGAVYLAAALAAHTQKGLPAFGIYGRDVQDVSDPSIPEDVKEKLLRFAKAGLAVALMRGKSYLAIGTVSMGIAGSIVNADLLQEYLGMRAEYVDSAEIIRRVQQNIYSQEEYEKALAWTKKHCMPKEGEDFNSETYKKSREQKDKDWEFVVKMTLIIKDLMIGNSQLKEMGFEEESMGHNAIASGFQGQRQWTDFMPNGDFSEAILNSSFDWNGIREPFVVATENDHLNGLSMLFGKLLTNTSQIFADVRTYWSPEAIERVSGWKPDGMLANGAIHLINSGACTLDGTGQQTKDGQPVIKPFWEIKEEEVDNMLNATTWYPASLEYFRGGGYSSHFLTKAGMPITMSRLNMVKGLGPVLQIAEGWTATFPEHVFEVINKRTDKTWPSTFFVPRTTGTGRFKDVYSVMNYWGANHGAISYGHIGADLISLASILSIPVCMHNVDEADIFRPSAWNAFGADLEGADYRACAAYGPPYK